MPQKQAKTSFGNIERPKCSLVTETETKAVLRKTILRQRNSAKRKQNRCFSKIKWKSGWLAAYWKKTLFRCNETENNPILQKKNPTCFLCFKAESNVFYQRKSEKAFFFVTLNSKQRDFVADIQKRNFATMRLDKRFSETKNEIAVSL